MLIISSSPLYHPGYNGYNACYIMVFPAARLLVHLPHPEAPVRRKPGSHRGVKLPMKKNHMAGFHSHGGPPNGWFPYMFIMETLIYKWMISHQHPLAIYSFGNQMGCTDVYTVICYIMYNTNIMVSEFDNRTLGKVIPCWWFHRILENRHPKTWFQYVRTSIGWFHRVQYYNTANFR